MESAFPRPMSDEESAVLEFLLRADFQGVEALRAQARHAVVTYTCPCGCPTFGIEVDKSMAARAELNPKTPVDVEAGSVSFDPYYELLLFTDDGWLSSVELVWYGDSPPSGFPAVSAFNAPKQLTYGGVRRYTPE